jgi:cytochrome c2
MRRSVVGFSLVVAGLLATAVGAQDSDLAAGKLLYRDNCGTCHGLLDSEARVRVPGPPSAQLLQAARLPWLATLVTMSADGLRLAPGGQVTPQVATDGERVAVAPPYGPPLRGVIGRPAGSVPNFTYSRAFKTVLQGVVWERGTLNVWITDSQAWVPGSMMFYAQPDAEIRHKIITYLEAQK